MEGPEGAFDSNRFFQNRQASTSLYLHQKPHKVSFKWSWTSEDEIPQNQPNPFLSQAEWIVRALEEKPPFLRAAVVAFFFQFGFFRCSRRVLRF